MYQESHGVVGNTVFDKTLNRTLTIKDSELFTQNPGVMPLWVRSLSGIKLLLSCYDEVKVLDKPE